MSRALLVAHGAPADPEPQEAALRDLATRVGALLPGWRVLGATLAMPGALERAAVGLGPGALVYPFFMAEGWFTGRELPRRLVGTGVAGLRQVRPFGTDPDLPALMARVAEDGARGLDLSGTALLLAAHGSKVSRSSADSTWAMVRQMRARTGFARVVAGFVEEAPFLHEAAAGLGPAVCLPFFALRAGHVAGDVPQALDRAGFTGPRLPAIGEHPEAAALIAAALRRDGANQVRDKG